MEVPGLRSSYEKVGGVVHFGRMIDKIRLHASGNLPSEYHPFIGGTDPHAFDGRCCRFLKIDFDELAREASGNGTAEELFEWACARGRCPSDLEIEIWNGFMEKRGWRDSASRSLQEELAREGLKGSGAVTFFDYHDLDEGRPLRFPVDAPATGIAPAPDRITLVPGLRGAYERVGGIVHFGRMVDKIRLFHEGKLPSLWIQARGSLPGFDGTCCNFLKIDYTALENETLKGLGDEELMEWATTNGQKPNEEEIEIWNAYLSKRCWRDKYASRLQQRLEEIGMPAGSVYTMFDLIDLDEGRPFRG